MVGLHGHPLARVSRITPRHTGPGAENPTDTEADVTPIPYRLETLTALKVRHAQERGTAPPPNFRRHLGHRLTALCFLLGPGFWLRLEAANL